MVKLILCLFSTVAIAVCLVQIRQQRMELNHQTNQLHGQIEATQARLWSQQLQIARATAPAALQAQLGTHDLKTEPLPAVDLSKRNTRPPM